ILFFFFFQAEDGIRDFHVTGVQTCALPIYPDMDGRGLVWRLIASDVYQANAIADRMNAIASQNSTAILYKNDSYGTDLAQDILRSEERRVGKEGRCQGAGDQ